MRGHALQDGGRSGIEVDRRRDLDELPGGDGLVFGLGAARHRVDDAIAWFDIGDVERDVFDRSGAFASENNGRLRGIQARAEISINEVDTRGGDFDQRLAGRKLRLGHFGVLQVLDAARLFDNNGFHKVRSFLRRWTVMAYRIRYSRVKGNDSSRAMVRMAPAPVSPARKRTKWRIVPRWPRSIQK